MQRIIYILELRIFVLNYKINLHPVHNLDGHWNAECALVFVTIC